MRKIDLAAYKSTTELYEKNKKNIKLRWILFSVFLIAIVILLTAALIEYSANKQNYIANYFIIFSKNKAPSEAEEISKQLYNQKFAISLVMSLLSAAFFIWHIFSLNSAFKAKDFTKYSRWLSMLYSTILIFTILNLFLSGFSIFRIQSWNINQILSLIFTIILIVGYFTLYWPCSSIIRAFRNFKVQQQFKELQNNPMIMFNQMFGNQFNQPNNMDNDIKHSENNDLDLNKSKDNDNQKINNDDIDYRSQLETLDNEKLIMMAEKLNIFDAKSLERNKLIEKIVIIFQNLDKNKQSKQVQTNKTNEAKNEEENRNSSNDQQDDQIN